MNRLLAWECFFILMFPLPILAGETATTDIRSPDPYTLVGERNFLTGYAPVNEDGTVNVVIEIPAGDNDKWEVKKEGTLRRDFKEGMPRVVQYLSYPVNYGMVPRTVLAKEAGGDGDPLDALILGPAIARGTVVRARLIGVLRLIDGGEKDDKVIGVRDAGPFTDVRSLEDLNRNYPGVTQILETWFLHYKGPGKMESLGFGEADEALRLLESTRRDFEAKNGVADGGG